MKRTRVKICGLRRAEDVTAAVEAGADAVGFVCYEHSPRYVTPKEIGPLAACLQPFVTPVLLFVNASAAEVRKALEACPHALLQFHGDEDEASCRAFGRPYIRAVRMGAGVDLLDCERGFSSALALLADAPAAGYGGGGEAFDWTRLPTRAARSKPLVLAGGLDADNVAEAILEVRPDAVDVSSGVEASRGIKDPEKIRKFIAAVRAADRVAPVD